MTLPSSPIQFPYIRRDPALGSASLSPFLPITLQTPQAVVQQMGLLDTGAAVNVLPFSVGEQLGFDWDSQATSVQLTGNLASVEARVVVVLCTIGSFAPVRLAFAWAKSDAMPVLLGQINFFIEFEACFFRGRGIFEVRPKP